MQIKSFYRYILLINPERDDLKDEDVQVER